MFSSIPIHIHLTTSINIRLTHGSRTTVANARFHKKGQPYQKSFQKTSFGFPIKSYPIPKKSLYIHGHRNKPPPNGGDYYANYLPNFLFSFLLCINYILHILKKVKGVLQTNDIFKQLNTSHNRCQSYVTSHSYH